MKNKEIIEKLDFIDKYIKENVGKNGKIINNKDIYARINIETLQQIKKELNEKNAGDILKNRVEKTENAFLYVMDKAKLEPNNKYFEWLNTTMDNGYYLKPNYQQLYYSIATGHYPNVLPNYVKEYLPKDTPDREALIYNLEMIKQEYDNFLIKDEQLKNETSLIVRKRNPIQKFFDKIFNKEKKNKKKNNETKTQKPYDGHSKYCEQLRNSDNYTKETEINKNNQQEQVIAVSDLHGNIEKWNQIKKYMETNPNMKVMILGDATDRGENGIEILMQIKELCDTGKAKYLPGNHDVFLYNYVKTNNILSRLSDDKKVENTNIIKIAGREWAHLERNGGENTLESLKSFDNIVRTEIQKGNIKNNISKDELIAWLGKQPIQEKIIVNNTEYALAHAWFDNDLYEEDKNFNLEKALQLEIQGEKNSDILNRFKNIMWYREENANTHYSTVSFPKGAVMVVGHTPQVEGINVKNFLNNPNSQVIYIDTGKETAIFDLSNRKCKEYKQNER